MQLLELTLDQIQCRCTTQSFVRGTEYFHTGAIGNPVLHGWMLSAICQGSSSEPYRTSVELMPTGIISTYCSCPYSGEGDCKHIIALLLTYTEASETICSVDTLLTTLAIKPKANLLRVISELLKRTPELASIVQVYADVPSTPSGSERLPLVTVYLERIDHIFGSGFLEQHQLRKVLIQLERLRHHAESLTQVGETEFALAILHALIHQSIVRYSDTLQKDELPRFVNKCTKAFVRIALNAQQPSETLKHCQMLLKLSFEAEPVFIPSMIHLVEELCSTPDTEDLRATIEQRLGESLDRQAHVQLLLALYFRAGRIEDYLRLARSEDEGYRLVHALFTFQHDDAAWEALKKLLLSADEYWDLLNSPIAKRIPEFVPKLLRSLSCHDPDTAITVYQKLIEQAALSRKQEGYEKVQGYLAELRTLCQYLGQENQWTAYLRQFRKEHTRKRLLLQIISEI